MMAELRLTLFESETCAGTDGSHRVRMTATDETLARRQTGDAITDDARVERVDAAADAGRRRQNDEADEAADDEAPGRTEPADTTCRRRIAGRSRRSRLQPCASHLNKFLPPASHRSATLRGSTF